MADLHTLIPAAVVVPLAEFQMIADAVASLHQAAANLSAMIVDRIDATEPDPDLEDNGDTEPNGDELDISSTEWDTRHPYQLRAGYEMADTVGRGYGLTEDDEEDDPSGQCDEDGVNTAFHLLGQRGAGCLISDEDCEGGNFVPSYGIDQRVMLNQPNDEGHDPAPDLMPSNEAGR